MRYFIRFSYDGSDFHGSQRQPNGITVQEVLEDAMTILLQQPISLTFAGRTDAGVHAECMYAHFDIEQAINTENIVSRLNNFLPASIAIQEILHVQDNAHARFDAISRRYEYRVYCNKNPFIQKYATRIPADMDFDAMNEAAKLLLGKQDFASFCKVHTDVKTTICNVTKAEWRKSNECQTNDEQIVGECRSSVGRVSADYRWTFEIEADRFLRNMVRAVVGTLFDIGKGKQTKEDLKNIINLQKRTAAGQSAPAEGLFLVEICYNPSIFTP